MAVINGDLLGLPTPDILIGTEEDDTINGLGAADILLSGGGGNDVVNGGVGDDLILSGGDGDDVLDGGASSGEVPIIDLLGVLVLDTEALCLYDGGAGNDRMNASPQALLENFDGGDGIDTADFTNRLQAVDIDLNRAGFGLLGGLLFDQVINTENVIGSDFDDSILGSAVANQLQGRAGDDTLDGRAGDDVLVGGSGMNTLLGGDGNDVMSGIGIDHMTGGTGDDLYYVNRADDVTQEDSDAGIDQILARVSYTLGDNVENMNLLGNADIDGLGNALDNAIRGNSGANVIHGFDGADRLNGGGGEDTIDGGGGDDEIDGLWGDDILSGGGGGDRIFGGSGGDILQGQHGTDRLFGGEGRDTLTGGEDRDVFVFADGDMGASVAAADLITDFDQALNEKVRLLDVDADTTTAGDQAFTWLGSGDFTGTAGELRYVHSGGNTYIRGDTDGDGAGDFVIGLIGLYDLTTADFVL